MTRPSALTDARDPRGGYVVRKPRVTDALGSSLLNVFAADPRLPTEIAALLHRIDAHTH